MRRPRATGGADPAARLRRAGLRATSPRLAVLALLRADPRHPAAEDVHAALRKSHPSLSLSTVYETLAAFLRSGIARRVGGGEGRLRVDGMADDHDHAVCRGCGRIFDVERGTASLADPPPRLPRGLRVLGVRLEYDVSCSSCFRGGPRPGGLAKPTRERPASARRLGPDIPKKETKQWRSSRARRRSRT